MLSLSFIYIVSYYIYIMLINIKKLVQFLQNGIVKLHLEEKMALLTNMRQSDFITIMLQKLIEKKKQEAIISPKTPTAINKP